MEFHQITVNLMAWFTSHARHLPWRDSRDPYSIWIAEIMLQQTRVETVIPYFHRWMERFPDISALSRADLQEVLSLWEGLGYYSRARNLHKSASIMMKEHEGKIPADFDQLIRLPGIGQSSAADILSIAFGQPFAALDGNIKRVLSRLFNIRDTLDSPEFISECRSCLDLMLPKEGPGDFNEAMMDLGAMICLPKNAKCPECPLIAFCAAYRSGEQNVLPVPKPPRSIPHVIVTAGVILDDVSHPGEALLAKRPAKGLLGGLWEFPGGKQEPAESLQECLVRELQEELGITTIIGKSLGIYKHAYTHFRVTLHAFYCHVTHGVPHPNDADEIAWVALEDLKNFPMGKLDRMITRSLIVKPLNEGSE